MSKISRRSFAALTASALAVTAQDKPKPPITAASVPEDPIAPEVSEGTQPDYQPFQNVGTFWNGW